MDIKTYQQGALQTEKSFEPAKRLRHALIGAITEIGEFASQVKRVVIYGKNIDTPRKEGEATPRQGMFEELADSNWYTAIAFAATGHEMRPVMYAVVFAEGATEEDRLATLTYTMASITGKLADLALLSDDELLASDENTSKLFGQLLYLVKMTAELLGGSLDQLFIDNNQKLLSGKTARYGANGYTDQAAEARADKDGAAHTAS